MLLFAASAANQHDLVAMEAEALGGTNINTLGGGVEFEGDLACAYRFCLHSRISSRLLIAIAQDDQIYTADDMYEASMQIPWETWLDPSKTFSVTVTAIRCSWLRNSTFGAIRLKDAVVDRLREQQQGERPSVDFEDPDVVFHLHIEEDRVMWYLDFSGRSLHKRGYRKGETAAILKENLAAAMLMRSEWYKTVTDGNAALLLDPFCGSGTICIEAAMMATDTAPGLIDPSRFAFLKLEMHDNDLWEAILDEAYNRQEAAANRQVRIIGWDVDSKAISISEANAKAAYVAHAIQFEKKDFINITEEDIPHEIGYVVTDPPYGMRMEQHGGIEEFYRAIGQIFNSKFPGWYVSILCGDKELLGYVDMKPDRTNSLYNGPLDSQLAHYRVFTVEQRQQMMEKAIERNRERLAQPLSPGAQMAFNRLKKNLERIKPLMEEEGVTSYRIYDADMPEYSAAIDVYEGKWVHLQEYAAPPTIDPEAAQIRLEELIDATERALEVERNIIYVKQRREQKDFSQYEKLATKGQRHIMREHNLMFSVNFTDYLDTGIFLDHRLVRKMIMEMAKDKRFLNLFCYTGTATVHAAAGGAVSTVSVDASATYLDWAMLNMRMNNFEGMNHFFYKADCIEWLKETYDKFDLIFCDPPTFSNSKMRRIFDVDRNQRQLIHSAMRHLDPNGVLIFSTNYRKFRLDESLEESYEVENISNDTIGKDFERDQKIHYCYLIRHKRAIVHINKRELEKTPARKIIRKKD